MVLINKHAAKIVLNSKDTRQDPVCMDVAGVNTKMEPYRLGELLEHTNARYQLAPRRYAKQAAQ